MPWVIATMYESSKYGGTTGVNGPDFVYEGYFVPAASLGFSVFVFCCLALSCIVFLAIRRIKFGGELGGPKNSRIASCILLVCFWMIYIILSIVQTGMTKKQKEGLAFGMDLTRKYRNNKNNNCNF